MGARDMSIINTPPQDRLPIHTEIIAFDETRIGQAIYRTSEAGFCRCVRRFDNRAGCGSADDLAALDQDLFER